MDKNCIFIYIYISIIITTYIYIYIKYIYTYIYIHVIVLLATLRTLFIYLIFTSGRYGEKSFFSIVGKSFDSLVRFTFIFYSFMLLFRNSLISQRIFSNDIPHLIRLFSFFILVDQYNGKK